MSAAVVADNSKITSFHQNHSALLVGCSFLPSLNLEIVLLFLTYVFMIATAQYKTSARCRKEDVRRLFAQYRQERTAA